MTSCLFDNVADRLDHLLWRFVLYVVLTVGVCDVLSAGKQPGEIVLRRQVRPPKHLGEIHRCIGGKTSTEGVRIKPV